MFKKIILPGLVIGLVNFFITMAISQIFGVAFPSVAEEYLNPNLFRSNADPLMLLFFLYPFLLGIILAWFWNKTKSLYSSDIKGGLKFGLNYWVVAVIPGMFATYSSMPYSFLIVASWLTQGLVSAFVAGIILSKFNKI